MSLIPVGFYHVVFIIKKLANEFEEQFEFLGEKTKKYNVFYVPIEKDVTNIDKNYNAQCHYVLQNKTY